MMNDTSQNTIASEPPMSEREKLLAERAGSRMLLIWLLVLLIGIESLVIIHLVK
jgi:hypothetical protein